MLKDVEQQLEAALAASKVCEWPVSPYMKAIYQRKLDNGRYEVVIVPEKLLTKEEKEYQQIHEDAESDMDDIMDAMNGWDIHEKRTIKIPTR